MKTISNLPEFWQEYYLNTAMVNAADAWTIVFLARDGQDVLVSLANPRTEEHEEVFVQNVSNPDFATFAEHYKQRFSDQIPSRFGFFKPGVDRVLTEYPDWITFYDAWLQDDTQLVQGNMPLLFDFPSPQEYRAMQLKSADYAGYRRLLVVLYQHRKQQFQKVFIKNVDDTNFETIQRQITQLYKKVLPDLILKDKKSTNPNG